MKTSGFMLYDFLVGVGKPPLVPAQGRFMKGAGTASSPDRKREMRKRPDSESGSPPRFLRHLESALGSGGPRPEIAELPLGLGNDASPGQRAGKTVA